MMRICEKCGQMVDEVSVRCMACCGEAQEAAAPLETTSDRLDAVEAKSKTGDELCSQSMLFADLRMDEQNRRLEALENHVKALNKLTSPVARFALRMEQIESDHKCIAAEQQNAGECRLEFNDRLDTLAKQVEKLERYKDLWEVCDFCQRTLPIGLGLLHVDKSDPDHPIRSCVGGCAPLGERLNDEKSARERQFKIVTEDFGVHWDRLGNLFRSRDKHEEQIGTLESRVEDETRALTGMDLEWSRLRSRVDAVADRVTALEAEQKPKTAVGASAMSKDYQPPEPTRLRICPDCFHLTGEAGGVCRHCQEPRPQEPPEKLRAHVHIEDEPAEDLPPVAPGSESFVFDVDNWLFLWPASGENRLRTYLTGVFAENPGEITGDQRHHIAAVAIEEWTICWIAEGHVSLKWTEYDAAITQWRAWRDQKGE